MNSNEIVTSIVIPIISTLIGGLITLIGVIITIRSENKKSKKELEIHEKERKEEIRLMNEPLFYILDPMQDYDYKKAVEFVFLSNEEDTYSSQIIFKNTDKIQIILDYISINGKKYYPSNGTVVDKNVIFYISVFSSSKLLN